MLCVSGLPVLHPPSVCCKQRIPNIPDLNSLYTMRPLPVPLLLPLFARSGSAVSVVRTVAVFAILFSFSTMFSLRARAQQDSSYTKKNVSETEIQLLYSHYVQEGEHSAVTGGSGTEELQVASPDLYIVHSIDSAQKLYAGIGVDVVTSASTDRIDFHLSSASRRDLRGHLALGYSRQLGGAATGTGGGSVELGAKGLLSIESDYFSRGLDLWASSSDKWENRSVTLRLQAFFDDLRWGRLSSKHFLTPVKLIYPEELRYKEWDNRYDRTSLNAALGFTQVVNKRIIVGLFPGLVYQYGLLSTPFHRVYFSDTGQVRVEHLPDNRLKVPIGLQLNTFLGSRWVVRSYYRFYWDDFGILSNTGSVEVTAKLNPYFSVAPFARYYSQSRARYFQPFGEHSAADEFYTSDYDLSGFTSTEFGLGLRYAPLDPLFGGTFLFREIALRYSYYRRQDGLSAHFLSTVFSLKTGENK